MKGMHQHASQMNPYDFDGQVHLTITAPDYAHVISELWPYFEKLVPDGPSLTPYQEKVYLFVNSLIRSMTGQILNYDFSERLIPSVFELNVNVSVLLNFFFFF